MVWQALSLDDLMYGIRHAGVQVATAFEPALLSALRSSSAVLRPRCVQKGLRAEPSSARGCVKWSKAKSMAMGCSLMAEERTRSTLVSGR